MISQELLSDIYNYFKKENMDIRLLDFFKSPRKKVFFGSGKQMKVSYDILRSMGYKIEFLVISREGAQKTKVADGELPIYTIDELKKEEKEYDFLIAVNEKFNDEIKGILEKEGVSHIYWSEHWVKTNAILREILFEYYIKMHGAEYDKEKNLIKHKNFRICGSEGQDHGYRDMLLGEFNDIVQPSIFNDYSTLTEGAYEHKNVILEEGDIVFDLGANIGLFSCVAASKGCQVYAFEPTPSIIENLKKNQCLYNDFWIEPYAVCDYEGTAKFYVNSANNSSGDSDTGMNSMILKNSGMEEIEVPTITIDAFVKLRGLKSVDFIKADIEGAERDMLKGAFQTLKDYAPKLSLCTYHLPDDKEVLTKLILEANPNYVIEYKWLKLYAYVPGKK